MTDDDAATPAAPVKYDESPFPAWAPGVDKWQWHPMRASSGEIEGWWKRGNCPRCGDETTVEIGLVGAVMFEPDDSNQKFARCECGVKHDPDKLGCGAAGEVAGRPRQTRPAVTDNPQQPDGPGNPSPGPPVVIDLQPWQDKLEAARSTQYADLKASADKWAGTIAILVGAFGSISVVVVPKALSDFTPRPGSCGRSSSPSAPARLASSRSCWQRQPLKAGRRSTQGSTPGSIART